MHKLLSIGFFLISIVFFVMSVIVPYDAFLPIWCVGLTFHILGWCAFFFRFYREY